MITPPRPETALQRAFREILARREIPVRELAQALGVSPSALDHPLRRLEKSGRVAFHDRRKIVGLNPAFGHIVGIDLGASHLHFALADFRGEHVNESTARVRPEDGPRKMIAQIKKGVRQLLSSSPRGARNRLRGLAIGVPSPVDAERGVVAFANNLPGWRNIHLGHELQRAFRVPVFMENDVNMAAIGEHWHGIARGVDNFVFVALGTGIGSGIFIAGKLYRGRTGAAGELYRMNLEWPRWDEDFGDTGYLESYASGQGIAAEGRQLLSSISSNRAPSLAQERDAGFVFESVRAGDPRALAVLKKSFTILGVGIANVVAVLDPDLIVLGGGVVKGAPELLFATVEKVVHRVQPHPPPIKMSSLGDKAQTYGAICAALTVAQEAIIHRLR